MLHKAIQNREMDKLAAIRELHSIERTIKDIYKEVPQIGVPSEDVSTIQTEESELESTSTAEQWV
jgi:hypothetical protein